MVKGKATCKTLKAIRKQIAEANDIKYEPRECHYDGPCLGTCPACEAEVRYLEQQLSLRRQLGKAVAIVGISAGLSMLTANTAMAQSSVKNSQSEQEEMVLKCGEVVVEPQVFDTVQVYGIAEQMPMFPGGDKALAKFVTDSLRYPAEARAMGIQGRVVVQFVIERDGSIDSIKVVKKVSPELDAEAVRIVKAMPKWIPGRQNGFPIRMKYVIPITFRP